ncbi:MAG: putative rane protein [Labilithrix sp.]|nr:putative rane protein [Labilithrix sp.]
MFFYLSKILDLFFSPHTWGLVFLAAVVPWRMRAARRWRRRRAFGIAALVMLVTFSSSPVANTMLWRLEHATTPTYRDDVTYDAVVLLGGVVDEEVTAESGQPSYNDNVERVIMTHRLLRDGKARNAIVSGATLDPKLAAFGEAVVLGRQLEDWGIAKDRIIIEDKALNTRENAVYAKEIARARGFERVLIVTSAFHMARAVECFAAVDMKVDTLSVDYRAREHANIGFERWLPRAQSLAESAAVLRELSGRAIYRLRGYGKAVR